MFNKSIFLTSSGCSHRLFSYHISEVYAFYPINEREKQGRWGGGSCKKGELHMEEKKPKARREYKDTVFRMLFSDEKNLLSLYNAVTGRSYEDAKELEIVTLDNAVYMGMKNDLAFLLDLHISLYEHQSTKNPNMPLRDLFYISLEYQKYVSDKSLYSSALLKIPAPVFIVFYNGAEDMEERTELRLSQAYEHFEGEPNLELKVMVLNINAGHNAELMEQCRMLKEYAQYVARVRKYTKEMEFLRKNKSEVIAMSIFEYDKEEEEKKLRKAEFEAGEESKAKEIIGLMLSAGEPVEKIAQYTGYTIEEIQKS